MAKFDEKGYLIRKFVAYLNFYVFLFTYLPVDYECQKSKSKNTIFTVKLFYVKNT